jgi:hypothetical protein
MAIIIRIELKLQDYCGSYFADNGISTGNANAYFKDNGIDLQNPDVSQQACFCLPTEEPSAVLRERDMRGERGGQPGSLFDILTRPSSS